MRSKNTSAAIRARLDAEIGTIYSEAPERVALVYPSPYRVGMSSLGFQTLYREINSRRGRVAERAFMPDDEVGELLCYESGRPVADMPVIGLSVAYEIELAGVVSVLELAGIPALAERRDERHPFVLAGGPLTFSNPVPLGPFADAVLLGEADETIHEALDVVFAGGSRRTVLETLAREVPSAWVPSIHGETLGPLGISERLPARAQIITPNTELRNMFLIEGERGCSRGCRYCVMRRSTNGGMRIVPMEDVLGAIPEHAKRVGLVGAAISDHPKIVEIVETLAEQGREVGLSSLRPDKLKPPFVAALRRAGYRTLTTALDGASVRMRELVDRRAKTDHFTSAAQLAREHGYDRLKLYLMIGLPDETDDDIDELVGFATGLSKVVPIALGIAPFVSKRNTPLDRMPYAGIDVVDKRLARLRRGLKGRVDARATSARWGWIEYVLAQGGFAEGLAVMDAVHAGGKFADYKRAFATVPARPRSLVTV